MTSLFAAVEMAPRDPILGLNEQFNADPNPAKVNLGVGVYYDDNGKLPLLQCVAEAEKQMVEAPKARGYLPIYGIAAYDKAVQALVFGADIDAVKAGHEELLKASQEFAQRLYAATQAQQSQSSGASTTSAPNDDEVADAEIIDDEKSA